MVGILLHRCTGGAVRAARRIERARTAGHPIEVAIDEVRKAARPLLLTQRIHYTPEVAWVDELTVCLPAVHALPFEAKESRSRLRTAYTTVGPELKASSRQLPRPAVATESAVRS